MEKINNLLLKNNESHQSEHQVQFLSTSQMQILLGQHKLSHRNSCMGGPTLIHQLRPSLEVEFRLCLSRVSNRKLNFCRSRRLLSFQKTERNLIRICICKIVFFFLANTIYLPSIRSDELLSPFSQGMLDCIDCSSRAAALLSETCGRTMGNEALC